MDDMKTRMDNAWLEAEVARLRVESKLHEAMADLFQAERDNLRAERDAAVARMHVMREALVEARDEAHSVAHSEFDGVWDARDFAALTPLADAILFAALTPAALPDTTPPPDRPAAPMPAPGSA